MSEFRWHCQWWESWGSLNDEMSERISHNPISRRATQNWCALQHVRSPSPLQSSTVTTTVTIPAVTRVQQINFLSISVCLVRQHPSIMRSLRCAISCGEYFEPWRHMLSHETTVHCGGCPIRFAYRLSVLKLKPFSRTQKWNVPRGRKAWCCSLRW